MSGTYTASQFVEFAHGCNDGLRKNQAKISDFLSRHEHAMKILARRQQDALSDLVRAILPSLSAEAIARADKLLGASVLGRTDWPARVASERVRLGEVIARAEADPKYAQRGLVAFDDPSGLPATIARLQQERHEHEGVVSACDHPRMKHLYASQYGTPSYATGFWRMSYYADWKAGDEIVERFGALENFGQVREKYLAALSFLSGCDAWIARLEAEHEGIRAVVRARDEAHKKRADIERVVLDEAQTEVRARLAQSGLVALGPWLSGDPEVYKLALHCEGLRAQSAYLSGIVENAIRPLDHDLSTFRARLESDIGKFSATRRAGKTLPREGVDKRMAVPARAFKRLFEKNEPAYNAVGRFQHFDRGRLDEDFLWWELMVGAGYAAVVPEVVAFLAARPDHVPFTQTAHGEDEESVAEAAAEIAEAAAETDLGDVS